MRNAEAGKTIGVTGELPWAMNFDGGAADADAVLFRYAGQHFGSNDQEHHCNFAKYDNMKREGDCGFTYCL